MGNIGISAAAAAGSAATAAMMAASAQTAGAAGAAGAAAGGAASTGMAIGTGMAGSATAAGSGGAIGGAVGMTGAGTAVGAAGTGAATGTAGGAVAVGGKAGGSGLLIKIVAGAAGVAVIGGAVAVGVGVASSSGGKQGGAAAGEESAGPMDEGIRDVDFSNITITEPDGLAEWGANQNIPAEDITLVNGVGEQVLDPADQDFGTLYFEVSQEPVYGDLDGDNHLDAAMVLSTSGLVNAADFIHLLVVWRGTPDGPVQAEHGLSYVFGMHQGTWGTQVSGLKESDGGITVTLNSSVGNQGGGGSINEDADFTLGLKDGWLVSTAPSYGAGDTCLPDQSTAPVIVDSPVEARIAADENSPLVADPAEIDHAEVSYLDTERPFTLARIIDTEGTTHCGWIPSG